jgi:hypothetical protein
VNNGRSTHGNGANSHMLNAIKLNPVTMQR